MKHSRRDLLRIGGLLGTFAILWIWLTGPVHQEIRSGRVDQDPVDGKVAVSPSEGTAGTYGTWSVTYLVGKGGIHKNGGIRVQLPDSWHAGIRNSANRLQATDPRADHYVSSSCSRNDVRLRTVVEDEPGVGEVLVKGFRRSLDFRIGRYVYVVRVWVMEGELREGDSLSVVYGDRSGGSRGMLAAIISTRPESVLVAVDTAGTGDFQLHPDRPILQAQAGQATELMLSGTSLLVLGKPSELRLAVVDVNANPASSFEGEIELHVTHGQADVPSIVKFHSGRGWESVNFVPTQVGILRIEASALQGRLHAVGNPIRIFKQEPERKIYWGDLHSHTHYSVDGVGENNFEYARFISSLDFYAMTDHSAPAEGKFMQGLGPQLWREYTALVEKYHLPGKFVTLHAYEISFGPPYGHHNVYFRDRPGPLLVEGDQTLYEV